MSYLYEKEVFGRKEQRIDLPRFAADLAKELGGKLLPPGDYPGESQTIQIGADELQLSADNWKKRVSASLSAPDVAWGDWSTMDDKQRAESATVNPNGRAIASIAKDIKKRVIEASQAAMAARRASGERNKRARADIVAKAAALKAACPDLQINVNEPNQVATIRAGAMSKLYLDAHLSPSGEVSIERIGGMSSEAFVKIISILEAEKPEDE